MVRSVSGSSRWGFPTVFSFSLLAREKENLSGKRRTINLLHFWSFPCNLGWQSEFCPQSHLPTMSLLLISGFPCSYFCIFWHFPLQLSFLVPLLLSQVYLFPKPWNCSAQVWWLSSPLLFLQVPADRAHSIAPSKLLSTPCSSLLLESNLLLIGLVGLCEVWDWLLQLLPSFRGPSIRTINQLSFPLQSGGKVFLSLHKWLLYMQKCMSAFCLL